MNYDLFETGLIKDKTRSPIRFPGSKYRASKYILPYIAKVSFDEYREPFLGSGAIFFSIKNPKYVWLNDIDRELINFFKIIANPINRKIIMKMVSKVKPSKELFEKIKMSNPKDDLHKAFKYFAINRMAYSGIMKNPNWGFHRLKSVQPNKWPERIQEAGIKLEGVKITNKDYGMVINAPSKNKVIMFIDPPYYKADQKRAYLHSFVEKDHQNLVRILKACDHKFCLTYDNCDEIIKMYKWANIHEYTWRYHTANSRVTTRKMGKELIITNY